jgi:hypothetical protein
MSILFMFRVKGNLMVPSAALCRSQESFHRLRAADTALDNVRMISTSAADAWGKEAAAAERREDRRVQVRLFAEAANVSGAEPDEDDGFPNENPDRGLVTMAFSGRSTLRDRGDGQ